MTAAAKLEGTVRASKILLSANRRVGGIQQTTPFAQAQTASNRAQIDQVLCESAHMTAAFSKKIRINLY